MFIIIVKPVFNTIKTPSILLSVANKISTYLDHKYLLQKNIFMWELNIFYYSLFRLLFLVIVLRNLSTVISMYNLDIWLCQYCICSWLILNDLSLNIYSSITALAISSIKSLKHTTYSKGGSGLDTVHWSKANTVVDVYFRFIKVK